MIPCPSLEQLQSLLRDRLSDAEVEAHVETCVLCQQALERLTDDATRTAQTPDASDNAGADFLRLLEQRPPDDVTLVPNLGPLAESSPRQATDQAAAGAVTLPAIEGYEMLAELGRGGMGVVYQARQRKLGRTVALKMILAGGHAGKQDFIRFLAEAEAVAQLRHPNIVQLYEFGQHQDLPFFTLEFVAGGSLTERLREGPLLPKEAARLVEQLARGMAHAHQHGIIHRDLKPANILLQKEEGRRMKDESDHRGKVSASSFILHPSSFVPKITDFGLVKRLEVGAGPTATGAVLGTPSYMPPEQASGAKEVGPAADIYSLGAILYECLTGRPPFQGPTILDTLLLVIDREPVPPTRLQPGVQRDLEIICLKCLRKEPARRYPSAAALADDLGRFLRGEPIVARRVSPLERAAKWVKRNRVVAGLAAALVVVVLAGSLAGLWIRSAILEQSQAEQDEAQAAGLVQRLLDAETARVPDVIAALDGYRAWADPLLWEQRRTAAPKSRQQLHASLALLPVDPGQADCLYERLLDAEPNEVTVLRQALEPYKSELIGKLWTVAEQPAQGKTARSLRAACALAKYDPTSLRWEKIQRPLATTLVGLPSVYAAGWLEPLRDARRKLARPLADIARAPSRRETERSLAAEFLAEYAADQPKLLAEVLLDAGAQQYAMLFPKLQKNVQPGLPVLLAELDKKVPAGASQEARVELAKRQANAAAALLRLGRPERAWQLLKHSADPTPRSYLIHRLAVLGVNPNLLVQRLNQQPEVSIERALLLSLGEFADTDLTRQERKGLVQKLQHTYRTAPDPGLHGAAEWLLRHWKQGHWLSEINEEWARDKQGRAKKLERLAKEMAPKRQDGLLGQIKLPSWAKKKLPAAWYVNGQGQTMIVIPGPVDFTMGSPATEKGHQKTAPQHSRRIKRSFALAAKAVSVAEFRRFQRGEWLNTEYVRTDDCPMTGMNWMEAAAYCNWLSEQEGINKDQWCYVTDGSGRVIGVKDKYLHLTGYRLPTEAEWEYACRAGAVTSRYYGEGEELLGKYGWHLKYTPDRVQPSGQLKPNDLGLFDMHGNVCVWCQDIYWPYPAAQAGQIYVDAEELDKKDVISTRAVRGGSFYFTPRNLRCGYRTLEAPNGRRFDYGLRPARTLVAY
jgi:serine/threonine protein kinase/formylglycine-generating enzyme required for sulfatase activity